MKIADKVDNKIVAKFNFPFGDNRFNETLQQIKKINGSVFDKSKRVWNLPLTKGTYEDLISAGFNIEKNLEDWYLSFSLKETLKPKIEIDGLFPFQNEGVAFVENCQGRAFIADECGLGKTIQAVSWLNIHRDKTPIIIVCPATIKEKWKAEIVQWSKFEKQDIVLLSGRTPFNIPKDKKIVIINYDVLQYWLEPLIQISPKVLVGDEIHFSKNSSAQRSKAMKILSQKIPHIIGLSGTPIENRPIEFFNALNMIRPDVFPNKFKYALKFCNARKNQWGWDLTGSSNREELHKLLTDTVMIRRKKVDVLPQLPTKTRSLIPITIDNMKEYWEAENDIISWIDKNEGSGKALRAMGSESLVKIVKLQQITSKGKIDSAISWIEDFIEETEEKLVVFCKFTNTIDILREKFKDSCVVIDGRTPTKDRMKIIDDEFVNNKDKRLFIGNIQIAVGFNLTVSSNVLYVEHSFKPSDHLQSEDRCIVENSLVACRQFGHRESMALKKIQDIKIGDKVHTQSGEEHSVISIGSRFHKGLITSINYVGWHEPLTCTHDHKILILRDDIIQWELAHKLLPTDYMVFPKIKKTVDIDYIKIEDKWRIYKNSNKPTHCIVDGCTKKITARSMCNLHYRNHIKNRKIPKPMQINSRYKRLPDIIPLNSDWLYLFGWFLAEGFSSIKKGKSRFISCSGHEKEMPILEKFQKLFETIGVKSGIYCRKKSKAIELRAYSGELAYWFRDWFGHLANNKSIPQELMFLTRDKTIHILNGYLDGGGYKRKNHQTWATVSRTLCWQIAMLAIRCGYIPNIRTTNPPTEGKGRFKGNHIVWHGFFTFHKNLPLQKQDENYIYRRIKSVTTRCDKVKVYDLTVKNDHSFTVGFSTVHNCLRIGAKNAVTCWYLIALNTIDEIIVNTIHKKMKIIDVIIDGASECGDEDSALDEIMTQLKVSKGKAIVT